MILIDISTFHLLLAITVVDLKNGTTVNFNVNTRVSITNYIYICTDDFEYESIGGGTRIILGCTIEEIRRTKNNNFDDKFSFLPREITNWRGGGRLII